MALNPKNVAIRALSGLIYIGLIIGAALWGEIGMALLASVFGVLAVYELESASLRDSSPRNWGIYFIIDSVALLLLIWLPTQVDVLIFAVSWMAVFSLRFLFQIFTPDENPLKSIAVSCLSQIYLAVPLMSLVLWRIILLQHAWILIAVISLIWINDTGAFLVGCTFGKHRLYERLSPKKSWEGFFGGVALSIGAGAVYYAIFRHIALPVINSISGWIIIAVCVSVFSTLGDLFESMIKRSLHVKDSGHIIPGHGGILDRIDSLLFVSPGMLLIIYFILLSIN